MKELIGRDFIVVDFKTTSYDESAEVISATIIDQDGKVLLDTLVLPEDATVIQAIYNFHELTPCEVENSGITNNEFLSKLDNILLNGSHDYLISYNAAFESRFIPNHVLQTQEVVCAMHVARSFFNSHPSFGGINNFLKLNGVAALLDIHVEHDEILTSLGDAKICLNVWHKILKDWCCLES